MARLAYEPSPLHEEPYDAAVPASSRLTLPGEEAPARSPGQVQTSLRLRLLP